MTTKEIFELTGYRSEGEFYLSHYFRELQVRGYIKGFSYETKSFILSEKVQYYFMKEMKTKSKPVARTLLQPHIYTPDLFILWDKSAEGIFTLRHRFNDALQPEFVVEVGETVSDFPFPYTNIVNKKSISIIEAKPIFDHQNMTRAFRINQKWMWSKRNRYVQLVIAEKLFEQTFYPHRYTTTVKGNPRQVIKDYKFIEDYIYERDTINTKATNISKLNS